MCLFAVRAMSSRDRGERQKVYWSVRLLVQVFEVLSLVVATGFVASLTIIWVIHNYGKFKISVAIRT